MSLFGIILLMIVLIIIGRRSPEVRLRQYFIIVVITFLQLSVVVFELFTKQIGRAHV